LARTCRHAPWRPERDSGHPRRDGRNRMVDEAKLR
jgi:hypothetical protein